MKQRSDARGFTLLEILVAATIVCVLSAAGMVAYASLNSRSRDVRRKHDIGQLQSALEMYRADNNAYPGTATGFVAVDSSTDLKTALIPTYVPSLPVDPKSTSTTTVSYYYAPVGTAAPFYSYCIFAKIENTADAVNNCDPTVTPPAGYNYGLKNP